MTRITTLTTALTLLLTGACALPPARNDPIPPACGSEIEIPVESTVPPKNLPIANPEVVLLVALATPLGCPVGVRIDGVDQFGRHGVNADTGRAYPWQGIRRSPYTHRIWFDPRIELDVSIEVFTHAEVAGEHRGCRILYQEREIAAKVVEPDPGRYEHFTVCRSHVRGPQVTP